MKTTIITSPKPELKFPCLMSYAPTGHVVLFSKMERGVVVHRANADWPVGYYSDTWLRADAPSWEIFNGKIELSN